ncbi:MAG: hypothetical protein HDT28_04510 [Clostridiales bacterium]|nr:hypothetical protein [Clostridiales bacterium]
MSSKERKIDQFLSIIILLLYAVIIAIKWAMVYTDVPATAIQAIDIIRTIVLCLIFLVVLYNACGWTNNLILKLLFLVIALFLIASAIAVQVPVVQEYFVANGIPLIL